MDLIEENNLYLRTVQLGYAQQLIETLKSENQRLRVELKEKSNRPFNQCDIEDTAVIYSQLGYLIAQASDTRLQIIIHHVHGLLGISIRDLVGRNSWHQAMNHED